MDGRLVRSPEGWSSNVLLTCVDHYRPEEFLSQAVVQWAFGLDEWKLY